MTQEGIEKEEITYEPSQILLSVKRHINMGDRSFQNTETEVFVMSGILLSEQLEELKQARKALNIWEHEERANYLEMQSDMVKQQKAFQEIEQFEQDQKDAKFRIELMDYIKLNPSCGIDELVLEFELSRYGINHHLDMLVDQGKIKHAECRLSFLVDKDGFAEEEDLEDPE